MQKSMRESASWDKSTARGVAELGRQTDCLAEVGGGEGCAIGQRAWRLAWVRGKHAKY